MPGLTLKKMPPIGLRQMEPMEMPKKLTTAIAVDMVKRIEALQEQIDEIYAEARSYDGVNNDSVIHDVVTAARKAREAREQEMALLAGFDAN